jgi:hypothetical protein
MGHQVIPKDSCDEPGELRVRVFNGGVLERRRIHALESRANDVSDDRCVIEMDFIRTAIGRGTGTLTGIDFIRVAIRRGTGRGIRFYVTRIARERENGDRVGTGRSGSVVGSGHRPWFVDLPLVLVQQAMTIEGRR